MSRGIAVKTGLRVTALFIDIGGVLLTNGWDEGARRRAAKAWALDYGEMEQRHHLNYDTHEAGKLSLDDYLARVVFYRPRPFSPEAFKVFMRAQSRSCPRMLAFVRELKARHRLKIVVVSNEGRELNLYRIQAFRLAEFVDFFVSSCFTGLRKPDADIYRLALDLAQTQPAQVACIDDRALFVEVARGLGMRGIRHTGCAATRKALEKLGLAL